METLGLARSLIDDFREQITVGKFAPGEKINEIKIAADLGISRSPLREALRVLENECLVVNIPRKGSFVTEMWLADLNEIYQMRELNAQVQLLVATIRRHEAAENEIVIEAHWDEVGVGD